jgi:hypothetical protein
VVSNRVNIYCDESCHLEYDRQPVMLLGCISVDESKVDELSREIRAIKEKMHARGELKWAKVSASRVEYFSAVSRWFLDRSDLRFRALVVPNKSVIDHASYNQRHDDFYYKLYYFLLKPLVSEDGEYSVYIDIKDTRSATKVIKLREVLSYGMHDFSQQKIARIQQMRSHESELLQLADFLLGATSYRWRGLETSAAKNSIVRSLESGIGRRLNHSTSPNETKFNVFRLDLKGQVSQ